MKVQEISPYPDVMSFLENIKGETDCKLGILTDGIPIKQYEKILRLGLDKYIQDVYISDEIGIRKPNPRLFESILEQSAQEPAKALYIGDHYHNDVVPAKQVGMQTCFIHREGKHDLILDQEMKAKVDYEVKNLEELWHMIKDSLARREK